MRNSRRIYHQVSSTWHEEESTSPWIVTNRMIQKIFSCSWMQDCIGVIEIPFLEFATELNPPTRPHCSHFKFQVIHVGCGETWKEKGIVDTYSIKCSLPNYTSPGATLKSFTSLDNTSVI